MIKSKCHSSVSYTHLDVYKRQGKNSSNTMKLAEICGQYCQTFHIEKASELPQFDLSTSFVIGVTAGASTPACIIKEVQETMSEFITNDELSFGEMLDQSFKSTYNGKKETGVVVGVTPVSYTHLFFPQGKCHIFQRKTHALPAPFFFCFNRY